MRCYGIIAKVGEVGLPTRTGRTTWTAFQASTKPTYIHTYEAGVFQLNSQDRPVVAPDAQVDGHVEPGVHGRAEVLQDSVEDGGVSLQYRPRQAESAELNELPGHPVAGKAPTAPRCLQRLPALVE